MGYCGKTGLEKEQDCEEGEGLALLVVDQILQFARVILAGKGHSPDLSLKHLKHVVFSLHVNSPDN